MIPARRIWEYVKTFEALQRVVNDTLALRPPVLEKILTCQCSKELDPHVLLITPSKPTEMAARLPDRC